MDLATLRASLRNGGPPPGLSPAQHVLWLERSGDWDGAHALAQDMPGTEGAWLHAYLHRREGDHGNAAYWYRRAGVRMPDVPLDLEWENLVRHFCA